LHVRAGKEAGARGKAGGGKKAGAGDVLYLAAPTRVRQKGRGRERAEKQGEGGGAHAPPGPFAHGPLLLRLWSSALGAARGPLRCCLLRR
jgi:hypothetical protein